jgi:hypothetical protein
MRGVEALFTKPKHSDYDVNFAVRLQGLEPGGPWDAVPAIGSD